MDDEKVRTAKTATMMDLISDKLMTFKTKYVNEYPNRKNYTFSCSNMILKTIFDYEKANKPARQIIDSKRYYITKLYYGDIMDFDEFPTENLLAAINEEQLKNEDTKLSLLSGYLNACRKSSAKGEKYDFVLIALMVLTVDKTNYENYLTVICDCARALGVNDNEFEDILKLIKLM